MLADPDAIWLARSAAKPTKPVLILRPATRGQSCSCCNCDEDELDGECSCAQSCNLPAVHVTSLYLGGARIPWNVSACPHHLPMLRHFISTAAKENSE